MKPTNPREQRGAMATNVVSNRLGTATSRFATLRMKHFCPARLLSRYETILYWYHIANLPEPLTVTTWPGQHEIVPKNA